MVIGLTVRSVLLSSLVGAIAVLMAEQAVAKPKLSPQNSLPPETALSSENSSGKNLVSPTQETAPLAETALSGEQQSSPTPSPIPPEVTILSPQESVTGAGTTNLVVQYPPGAQIKVTVNQKTIDAATPSQIQPDPAKNVVTQAWYGIPLNLGENILAVQPVGGKPVSVKVTVRETATRLLFVPATNPRIPADGRTTVTLEGQLTNDAGVAIERDVIVTLTASAGKFVGADQNPERPGFQILARGGKFMATLQSTLTTQKVRVRAAVDLQELRPAKDELGSTPVPPIQTQSNGRSSVESRPDLLPAAPSAIAPPDAALTSQLETYTQVEFITNLRAPIVSGIINVRLGASGTDFYGSFRDFLNPNVINDGTRLDVATAVFATGRIGDWLVTGAINNQRPLNQICDGSTRLFRDPQSCDQVYPVYGDSSTTDYITPSIDSVYLKVERTSPFAGAGTDFLMWGDYSSPEFSSASQYYTATNRQLHGLKGAYNFGNLQLTAMYGNNLQGFQRDAIAPDGTSGYYFLSRRLVLGGSENIYLETEELNRPGTIVGRQMLARGTDYEIDYDRGAVLFRRPMQQTEFDLFGRTLVRRIVATYQYEGTNTGGAHLYAGRLQYNFSRDQGQESWTGLSYLLEDQGGRRFELYGIDALIPLGKNARAIAEIARSNNDSIFQTGRVQGTAYRLEVTGSLLKGVLGQAYYRSVDQGFANNATFSFTPGQTRYGAGVSANLSETTQLQFQYDYEANFGIATQVQTTLTSLLNSATEPVPGSRVDNRLSTVRAGVQQKLGIVNLGVEWVNRSREDRITPTRFTETSQQLVSRLNVPLSSALMFRAQHELNISSQSDPLYPDRTTLGLDWAVYRGVTVQLAQQFFSGGQLPSNSITSLSTLLDQKLSEDTAVTGRYSILNGGNGLTSQGAIGLSHRIVLSPGLRMNLGYERIFGNIFAYTAAGQQYQTPYAVGQSAASLGVTGGDSYSLGVEYTDSPDFKATGRLEYRSSSAGSNFVVSTAAAGKISPSLTALGQFRQANYANQLLTGLGDTLNLKVGLAYRDPNDDKVNVLLRYEYRQNPSLIPQTIAFGSGTGSNEHLLAVEAIYAPNFRWEFYGKFALRSTRSYLASDLLGTNAISLGQLRATYRFNYRWDVTTEVRWIGQSVTGYDETGFALEAGYYLTPNLRVGAGYSFGGVYDRDLGSRTKGGFFVGLSLKLNELFSGWGIQPIAPPQQQESKVQPVAERPAQPNPPQFNSPMPASPISIQSLFAQPSLTSATTSVIGGMGK